MAIFLLSTFLNFVFFISFGFFFTKLFKVESTLVEKLLLGLVLVNTFTTSLSLFIPLNHVSLSIILILSLYFLITLKNELLPFKAKFLKKENLFFLFFPIYSFIISFQAPENYDSGLYHIQSIKWIEEYGVTPGLANLHGRFGFNSNLFTIIAQTSLFDLFGQEIFSTNFAVFVILQYYFMNILVRLYNTYNGVTNEFIFYLFIFLVLLKLPDLSTPSPDFLSRAIPLFVVSRFLEINKEKGLFQKLIYPILILSVYAATIKLATIPILMIFVIYIFKIRAQFKFKFCFLMFTVILLPWIARNVMLTGYILFPFSEIDLFNVDFKVPQVSVKFLQSEILGWARQPGSNYLKSVKYPFNIWFPHWFTALSSVQKLTFSLSFFSLGFIILSFNKYKYSLSIGSLVLAMLISITYWLCFAPDWRFGESFVYISAASPLLVINFKFTFNKRLRWVFIFLVFICFLPFLNRKFVKIYENSLNCYFHPIIPPKIVIPNGVTFRLNKINNVNFYSPNSLNQENRCFDHGIPCTPVTFELTNTKMRGEGLKEGFIFYSSK